MSPTKQDDETAKDSTTPDFLKGNNISPDEEKEMENAAYSGAASDIAAREGLSGDDLKTAEENPTSTPAKAAADPKENYKAGFGYREEGKPKKSKKKGNFFKRNQKWFIGGGIGSGIAGIGLGLILLLPLKVQHIANNLQSHFFASSEQATQNMTDKLFTQYLVKKVMPDMYKNRCTTTRASKSCVSVTPGDGPIARLYNAWRDKNFEGKLAENQGLEIRREGTKFYLKSHYLSDQVDLGNYDPKNPRAFEQTAFASMDKADVRREARRAFENETFAKRIMYHYKVGHLLERKYGVKRCLVACKTRDQRQDRTELRKLRWKAYFIDRIVTPRNEMLSLAMKCAVGGFSCTDPGSAEEDGERTSEIERETRARISELSANSDLDTQEQVKQLEDEANSIREKGLANHIIAKLTNQLVADVTTKAVPIVGWVQLAAQFDKSLESLGPALRKLNYVINSQTMVTMYMMYRTNADEIKTGEADAADVGIVADSLGSDAGTDQGGASAEAAPIYQDIMGVSPVKTASIFSAFSPKANAMSAYKCNDGSTIASGVCPELALNSVSFLTNSASTISKLYSSLESVPIVAGLSPSQAASMWLQTGGKLYDLAGGLMNHITDGLIAAATHTPIIGSLISPGIDLIKNKFDALITVLSTWFAKLFINDILGASPSGGRNFEIAAGGADVAGNSYAHYGLGGHRITDTAAAEIRTAMKEQEKEDFIHESTFARMFDTSSQYSLVSKVALALPSSSASVTMRSMASSLLNPFGTIATSYRPAQKAQAASTKDPFGVTQYGYSPNDEVFTAGDLQTYWDTHDCSNPDRAKLWGDAETGNVNPDTNMPENDLTNGCQLISTAVQMSGAMFDDSLLPPDELGSDSISNPTNTTTLPANCYTVTKQKGSITEGKMLHKEDNIPINTYAKENSPQGIKYAAKNGYDSIDLDIQITKDGVPVNTHWGQPMAKDGFYDPLHQLPDSKQVSDMTLAEVTRLRNHDGQSQIYSLQDQIQVLAANNVNLSLELKTGALVKTFPDITGWLNAANVKAYIKADASKPALDKALTDARNFGYWTRGTLGSQDWKAPGPNCVQ